jgi:hypothetical protein
VIFKGFKTSGSPLPPLKAMSRRTYADNVGKEDRRRLQSPMQLAVAVKSLEVFRIDKAWVRDIAGAYLLLYPCKFSTRKMMKILL